MNSYALGLNVCLFIICVNVLKTNPTSSSLPFYLDFTSYLHYNILYSITIYGILQKVGAVKGVFSGKGRSIRVHYMNGGTHQGGI